MDDTFEEDGETLSDGIRRFFYNTLSIFHNEVLKLEKSNFIHTCLNCSQSDWLYRFRVLDNSKDRDPQPFFRNLF